MCKCVFLAFLIVAGVASAAPLPTGIIIRVRPGQPIQAAIDRAQPGDRVEVDPGVYNESVVIDNANIQFVGNIVAGERPVLDGQTKLAGAVSAAGDSILIEGFTFRNYVDYGCTVKKSRNVTVRDLVVENSGALGIYPVECQGVLVESCVVTATRGAGICVAQCRDIVVRNCEAYNNVAGINSVNAVVSNNSAHHNSGGILVFSLPNAVDGGTRNCRVIHNRVWANNHENLGEAGSLVSTIPPGLGMLVMAADNTEISQNRFEDNGSCAIAVVSLLNSKLPADVLQNLAVEPNSDETFVQRNTYINNGKAASSAYLAAFPNVPPGDLFWDGTGKGNVWKEDPNVIAFPRDLPSPAEPR